MARCLCNVSKKKFGVELLLVAQVTTTVLSVLITYVLAVSNNDVHPYFPLISQTAERGPEKCIFSFGTNLAAAIGLFLIFVRYKHVVYLYSDSLHDISCLNVSSLLAGLLSTLGLMLVANFQADSVQSVHVSGALLLFLSGLIYQWLQTIISFKVYKAQLTRHSGSCVLCLRVLLTAISTAIAIISIVGVSLNVSALHFSKTLEHIVYLCGTSFEWALALSFLLYYLTFHPEFVAISTTFTVKHRYQPTNIITSSYGENTPLTI